MAYLVDVPPATFGQAPLYIIAANRKGGVHHKLFQVRIISGIFHAPAIDFGTLIVGLELSRRHR